MNSVSFHGTNTATNIFAKAGKKITQQKWYQAVHNCPPQTLIGGGLLLVLGAWLAAWSAKNTNSSDFLPLAPINTAANSQAKQPEVAPKLNMFA